MRRTAYVLVALAVVLHLAATAPATAADLRPSEVAAPQPAAEDRAMKNVTDDIPDFDRNAVRLDVPGELFGSSVNLVNRGSKVVGEVIMNTAVRFQRLVQALSPLFGRKLGITATRTRRDPNGVVVNAVR